MSSPSKLQLSLLGYFPSYTRPPTGDTDVPSRHLPSFILSPHPALALVVFR